MADNELLFPDAIIRNYDITTKYRKAHKFHSLFKSMPTRDIPEGFPEGYEYIPKLPDGMPIMGKPYSCSEKMDGTQVHIILKKNDPVIHFLSHNDNSIIKNGVTLEQLVAGNSNKKPFTYCGGNLQLFVDEIPKLRAIMDKYQIAEAHFYYELLFQIGVVTPKRIQYPNEVKNRCYLFNMVYHRINEKGETEVVKINITHLSKPIFDNFNISSVPLIPELCGDCLTLQLFEDILKYVSSNPIMEGVVFHQKESLVKILTIYNTEHLVKQEFDTFPEYIKVQDMCIKYMNVEKKKPLRINVNMIQKATNSVINLETINDEIAKEATHDNWTDFRNQFYTLLNDPNTKTKSKIHNLIYQSQLYIDVIESLKKEHEEFPMDMTKKQKNNIIAGIKTYFIENSDTLNPFIN